MDERLAMIVRETIINAVMISLLLIVLLLWAIRHYILHPVADIVAVISESDSEDGLPQSKVPENGPKEIALLSRSMNSMIGSIRTSQIELTRQKDQLYHQAHHDVLTGLGNRVLFNDRMEQGILKAKRQNTRLAVLFIDLDHFKEINDSFGHRVGDKVLEHVTGKLREVIRQNDTLARLGGDEFTVMIEDLRHLEDASVLAGKILSMLQEPIYINDHVFYIGCSIGISIYPDNGRSAQDLLKCADAAMYKAKSEGRNNFQYYSKEMTEQALERVIMETNLRSALANNEFEVYYQPQVDSRTFDLVGMEALVRWNHPTMGQVSPGRFIPIAESSGLIVDIDRFVMRSAMWQFALWYKEGFEPGVLAMNLAVKQLHQSDFLDMLQGLMHETGCRPEWLELEVTESQIMTKPDESIEVLKQLSAWGIHIALDDFGTGYSSLAYLKRLPITKLKIDRSFIEDLPHDEEDSTITKAVIALASSLRLETIAEGVELEAQLNFLVEHACDQIQGYYFSRPIPRNDMTRLLAEGGRFKVSAAADAVL
jgi:diguanylate cyclase (GGDEF)-like protein